MMTTNKAWCEDLIKFIKVFKRENVRRKVSHRRNLP